MKIIKLSIAILSLSITSTSMAVSNPTALIHSDTTSETFKVYGNCGMCKKTIESSLVNVKGIIKAIWNIESKIMEVQFDEHKITLNEVKQKIAAVGYDTDEFRAPDKVYNGLMACCQYERPIK